MQLIREEEYSRQIDMAAKRQMDSSFIAFGQFPPPKEDSKLFKFTVIFVKAWNSLRKLNKEG